MATATQTALFGPDLYPPIEKVSGQLSEDMKIVTELRKSWNPTIGLQLFDARNPVGIYDAHMRAAIFQECLAWTRDLKDLPDPELLATAAPSRLAFLPRGEYLLRCFRESFPDVPDTPFWHAVAEQVYSFTWCLSDNTKLCHECVHGSCTAGVLACFPDYLHFLGELPVVLDICTQRVSEYIEHVHRDHGPGPHRKIMDAWLMCVQSVYLDVLHPKATELKFPDDERRSISYRLINSAGRALALHAQLEQPLIGTDEEVDAISFASTVMHDICDYRHDNMTKEYYNLLTIVSVHQEVPGTAIVRRFCIDVWAWALDNGALWAIHLAGRELAWQIYMARYQTGLLLDKLMPPRKNSPGSDVDPYGDAVLNAMNPMLKAVGRSDQPGNYSLRDRCQNPQRYDELLQHCVLHFEECSRCRGYDAMTWQERVPAIGKAYEKKYTDCSCMNIISAYMILTSPDRLWWLADPTAEYTGPQEEWSALLC
ncbi:uncharacterized protein AKAW2_60030S [Aspergillus luchuensis]|uniref:Similar to An15g07630 n=1 Tax=Aspergillus kawachii TaxID=1069201 RepID=A0A146F6Z1_ASPKA|nr:uncharacterized protein AKAW2_60030S [Aspergillus luchuensis]BCS01766.1 hypothetical protein AKAW2_60030S [Aspergillus luchuensis]BCS13472.1 hypothetical protein ALUC_60028S [Aspergillus luchuensis]GAA92165.1 similar to An15g07630 [Aspergillus luchuensis IFO 4308]GAT21805.1 similar to An15g07630 [Aspergillus luchuensis]